MRRRLRSNNSTILKLAMVGIVAMAGGFLLTSLMASKGETQALSATEFQPGRIIDDSVFYNPNTMTAAEIDAFIDSHNPACDMWGTQKVYGNVTRAEYVKQLRASGNTKYHDPPFVCISEYYENPETHKTNFSTGGKKEEGMLSAGEIIYKAAQEYSINPQVLLVMLKKESYVWGDDWPHNFQYNTVMGYACPDGAPCDTKYYGFYNQVMMAAWQLNYYRDHIYSYNYRPYTTNNILYNPDRSCGSKSVYLENIATTSLYIYTPYVPNDAALANYPGTSWCGSYGNRNFYMYFREWFGGTLESPKEEAYFPDEEYYIVPADDYTKTLQLSTADNSAGTKVNLGKRSESAYNKWKIEKQDNDSFVLINSGSNLALDMTGGLLQVGIEIEQWTTHRGSAQQFVFLDNNDGTFSIAAKGNKNLSIAASDNIAALNWAAESNNNSFRLISTAPPVKDGTYLISSAINPNYTIDVTGGNISASGVNIELWSSHYGKNQKFVFSRDSETGYYTIATEYNNNYVLDVNGASKATNANIQIWEANRSCAQLWRIAKNQDNTVHFYNACGNKSLDLHGASTHDGANIATWSNHFGKSESWLLVDTAIKSEQLLDNNRYTLKVHENSKLSLSRNSDNSLALSDNSNSQESLFDLKYNSDAELYEITDALSGYYLLESSFSEQGTHERFWKIVKNKDNSYTLINASSNIALLDKDWEIEIYTPKQILEDGDYHIYSKANNNYSLDINGAGSNLNTNIQTWANNSSKAQVFRLKYNADRESFTISDTYTGHVLDVIGGVSYNEANVAMWIPNGGCNQSWIITRNSDDSYRIQESCGGRSLDVKYGTPSSGQNVQVFDSHNNDNQKWIINR